MTSFTGGSANQRSGQITGVSSLFTPLQLGPIMLPNRIVMAPMTRGFSPGGVPGPDVAGYYRRRAEAGVGLIITEGTWVPHPAASNEEGVPRFYGDDALAGWRHVVEEVHAVGGRIMPQLWHVGLVRKPKIENLYDKVSGGLDNMVSPSGYVLPGEQVGREMSEAEIAAVIDAFAVAAGNARDLGFDGIEIHAAHGYLIDQFFWHETNRRQDGWGGDLVQRARFGLEIVRACRARVGPDFIISLRFSQWKQQDYEARLAETPEALASFLEPLADAGVDIFHASQRRFWEPEFPGSDLNLAGWTRKLTGKPAISVGSVGIEQDFLETMFKRDNATTIGIERLIDMMDRGDFDLVAVGRALLLDPQWADKIRRNAQDELQVYTRAALASLS